MTDDELKALVEAEEVRQGKKWTPEEKLHFMNSTRRNTKEECLRIQAETLARMAQAKVNREDPTT